MPDDNGQVLHEIDPKRVRRIHLVGVGGTGMGSFAGMLKAAGYEVTGQRRERLPADERHARGVGHPGAHALLARPTSTPRGPTW